MSSREIYLVLASFFILELGEEAMLPIIRFALIFCAIALVLPSVACPTVSAVDIHSGDVLVVTADASIIRVDPTSGAQTVVSSNSVGTGPLLELPTIAISSKGELFAGGTLNNGPAIIQIDPVTGNRTLVSDITRGSGPTSDTFGDNFFPLAVLSDGSLFTGKGWDPGSYLRIDPLTGDRTPLPPAAEQSPTITDGTWVAAAAGGDVYLKDYSGPLFQLDPVTGAHHLVSNSSVSNDINMGWVPVGDGPSLAGTSYGMTFDPKAGRIYVINSLGLIAIDPVTGDRSYVSHFSNIDPIGSGILPSPFGNYLAMEPDGSVLHLDWNNRLIRFDTSTGDRLLVTQLSDPPREYYYGSFVVVPNAVPEPSSLALALAGACVWLIRNRMCRPAGRLR